MLCKDVIRILDRLAPQTLACEWDNPGFQAGRADKEIRKVLVALDATDEVVDLAVRDGADLLVTHHPLIFKPLSLVNDQNFISRRIVRLLQADICYFAMHTNFDAAPGCMADLAAERLGLEPRCPLEVTGEVDGALIGIGKVGTLPHPTTVEELAETVKERFELPFVTVYGTEAVTEPVTRVAISPGSGGSMVRPAIEQQVQVLITGDIGHHDGIDAAARHMAVIDAGHYGIEHIFIPFIKAYLDKLPEAGLEVVTAPLAFPAKVIV